MQNSPELSGKYLGTISSDFVIIASTLSEASYHIRQRKISEFPIFPICKEPQPVGQLLLDKQEVAMQWNFYASFVQEFEQRGLIDELETFKQAYKNPDEFCCLFVIDQEFTNFVFIPYPNDVAEAEV